MPLNHVNASFCLQHIAALPFIEQTLPPPAALRACVSCDNDAVSLLWRLDWAQLAADDRAFLESGEYLPALVFCWLQQAAALLRFCQQHGYRAALWVLPTGQLTELAISDLLQEMGSDAWLDDAQIALLWGVPHHALNPGRWHRPLPCRGALFPCGDGLNSGWWARPEDKAQLVVGIGCAHPSRA